ncbi:MAG: zinc ribbon domain-containing protein [Rhodoferax sp.]|nr:zinc ribbon domain-containing protein [Rhodoferax sp.]
MLTRCPKCAHTPLPEDQALPAACSACGAILAKVAHLLEDDEEAVPPRGAARSRRSVQGRNSAHANGAPSALRTLLLHPATEADPVVFWSRAALWLAFALWGLNLMAQDYRVGEIGASFIHRPLLVFHEAGHVVFRLFGEWLMVLGGTLGQLLMPAILGAALLRQNRDPFGASIGLWLLGVSLLDIAPYLYDALHPQLMLLSGATGEDGGHDWIYLLSSLGLLEKSQALGALVHHLGAGVVLLALGWGAWLLWLSGPGSCRRRPTE